MSEAVRRFESIVRQRGDALRKLPFQLLTQLVEPADVFTIGNRKARVTTIINHLPSGGILVVVQGFLKKRFLPMVWDVALDGFYKYPDETTAPMTREDMWAYD